MALIIDDIAALVSEVAIETAEESVEVIGDSINEAGSFVSEDADLAEINTAYITDNEIVGDEVSESEYYHDTKHLDSNDAVSDNQSFGINESSTLEKDIQYDTQEFKNEGVSEEKRTELESKGFSPEVIDVMNSDEEATIYENANLEEGEINGKKCLQKTDIDPDQKDEFGMTNRERMQNGNPPIDKNGETIELHHVGQKTDSPLAELSTTEHRGKGNHGVLHDMKKDSEVHTPENQAKWDHERKEYWKERTKDFD